MTEPSHVDPPVTDNDAPAEADVQPMEAQPTEAQPQVEAAPVEAEVSAPENDTTVGDATPEAPVVVPMNTIPSAGSIPAAAPSEPSALNAQRNAVIAELRTEVEELEKGSGEGRKSAAALKKKALRRYLREQELKPYQAELIAMQKHLEETHTRMIILFEGRDAAGKGGTIRRVTRYMNEKHYRVVALGKPTDQQRTQWFFQRYISHFPRAGEVVMFDRSWYNRAMVEPVFGFCTEKEYKNFMRGVTGFEKDLVRQGTILVKLYFSVTKERQAARFESRKNDPLRQWKLSEIDAQAQEKWDDFTNQKYEMLRRTHTAHAPWKVIRSDDKHAARVNAMKVILNSVSYERLDEGLDFVPDPEIVISGSRELEMMEAQRLKSGKFLS